MNVLLDCWLFLLICWAISQIGCNAFDRPTRRELQTNKTIFMYSCVKKTICKQYVQQNALKHINCESLCHLSWKWAHMDPSDDPLFTLAPEEDDLIEQTHHESGQSGKSLQKGKKPFTRKTNKVSAIGRHQVERAEGGAEPRERHSQHENLGRPPYSGESIVKSEEQKQTEAKGSHKKGSHGKKTHKS